MIDSKLINELPDLCVKLDLVSVYDTCCYSTQELIYMVLRKLNETIIEMNRFEGAVSDEILEQNKKIEYLLNEGVSIEVIKKLEEMLADGTLTDLINVTIFRKLNEKLDNNIEETQKNTKDIEKNSQDIISNSSNIISNGEAIKLNTELIEKINKNNISLDYFGCVGDGVFDNKDVFKKAVKYCKDNNIGTLKIPNGLFYTTEGITKGELFIEGMYNPNMPFLDTTYTLPNSTDNRYKEYLKLCSGSIITSDRDIDIFTDGLYGRNFGIFGNCRARNQNGIGQKDGGPEHQVHISEIMIRGCGKNGIDAPFGLIDPDIEKCSIRQNGKHGIYIGKQKGTYTGETNQVLIRNNDINRNELDGVYMDILGRHISIVHNSFEACGEVAQAGRPKPTTYDNIKYGCVIKLEGHGGFGTGNVEFTGNYSEESFGLLSLESSTSADTVIIENNMWLPYNQVDKCCGVRLKGRLSRVRVMNNKIYSAKDTVRIESSEVIGIEIDIEYVNAGFLNGNMTFTSNQNASLPVNNWYSMGTFHWFNNDNTCLEVRYENGEKMTAFSFDKSKLNNVTLNRGVNIESDSSDNPLIGKMLKINSINIGYIMKVSWTAGYLYVRNDKTNTPLGSKRLEILEGGGYHITNANGGYSTIVVDSDGSVIALPV